MYADEKQAIVRETCGCKDGPAAESPHCDLATKGEAGCLFDEIG
jgi:hypothetical protein